MDEVGRGAWAGPVVAAAVVLSNDNLILKDSKQLSKKQRDVLTEQIKQNSISVGVGWVSNKLVDELGLDHAVEEAMRQALSQINCEYDQIIIDGNRNFLADNDKAVTIVKADQTVTSVSAASIIAKVERDRYMAKLALKFPGYGFEKHVGYGTRLHLEKLIDLGVCSAHRLSYKPIANLIQA
ncbi:MAG TPA: ribonuclease HII [Candidatus Saccharimonadales bacterium]|nr:ribonuclease HII [Candidatus Saccharimonadales bacterium]